MHKFVCDYTNHMNNFIHVFLRRNIQSTFEEYRTFVLKAEIIYHDASKRHVLLYKYNTQEKRPNLCLSINNSVCYMYTLYCKLQLLFFFRYSEFLACKHCNIFSDSSLRVCFSGNVKFLKGLPVYPKKENIFFCCV